MNNNANNDKVLLLLSADWFRPIWSKVGLNFSESIMNMIQPAARETIREMMRDSKEYWHVDLSEDRQMMSWQIFEKKVYESTHFTKNISTSLNKARSLFGYEEFEEKKTTWVLGAICDTFLQDQDSIKELHLSESVEMRLLKIHSNRSVDELQSNFDLGRLALLSKTSWDGYLRSITPGSPTYLSDFATLQFESVAPFEKFWRNITNVLSPEERMLFINSVLLEAQKLGGEDFVPALPSWIASTINP